MVRVHLRLLLGSSLLPVACGSPLQTWLFHVCFPKVSGLLAGWVVGGLQALLRHHLVSLVLLRLPQTHYQLIAVNQ